MKPYRRFTHISGFKDDTKELQYRNDNKPLFIIPKNPKRRCYRSICYSLERALEFVKRGLWKEL